MANHTPGYAANLAVRALLRKVVQKYGESIFDHLGKNRKEWEDLKETFNYRCAYCGIKADNLQAEHLYMANQEQVGLHLLSNLVPCCKKCNVRKTIKKDGKTVYVSWEAQLEYKFSKDHGLDSDMNDRLKMIKEHLNDGYPDISEKEKEELKDLASSLHKLITCQIEERNVRFSGGTR